jgi:hypothetical protein
MSILETMPPKASSASSPCSAADGLPSRMALAGSVASRQRWSLTRALAAMPAAVGGRRFVASHALLSLLGRRSVDGSTWPVIRSRRSLAQTP